MSVDEMPDADVPRKSPERDILVLGRLTPSKRIEESIKASVVLRELGWTGTVLIAGDGGSEYREALQRLATHLHAPVKFLGKVSSKARRSLLMDCSVLWMTSAREGWGLVVTEAACHGTPSIVYDVAGLRDSVIDGVTGYVTSPTPRDLADATFRLFDGAWSAVAANALREARRCSWEATTDSFEEALVEVTRRYASPPKASAILC